MTEQPEQVLPQHRVRALGPVEEVRPEPAVEQQLEEADGQHRQGEDQQELHHEGHPHEHRHAHQAHPGRPHVDDGDGQVDG